MKTMIFTLALCLGAVAAATDSQHGERSETLGKLDIQEVVKADEPLVVLERKHTRQYKFRCQMATNKGGSVETGYNYTLRARYTNGTDAPYVEGTVKIMLEPLGVRGAPYKATYKDRNGIHFTLTLEAMGKNGTCFVILTNKTDGNTGCELLVPVSRKDDDVPEVCDKHYSEKCDGPTQRLYEPYCIYPSEESPL
ncbi:hypothetical protein V5799_003088 [Amblyomma americanum]|uniref:Secreted protein n=1 Tax=Amblyomma americanum TaxID=6943 RepID=A0AAQ4D9Y9_AMBAM